MTYYGCNDFVILFKYISCIYNYLSFCNTLLSILYGWKKRALVMGADFADEKVYSPSLQNPKQSAQIPNMCHIRDGVWECSCSY